MVIYTVVSGQDQKGRHLFDPTSKDQMREFSIDRPDVTESAITVDAGHFQFEGDLFKWTKHHGGTSDHTISLMNGLYKIGLTHAWDIHIGIELYNIHQDSEGNTYEKGYGATTIRLKRNLWGNDGGTKTAFGMIPYVTFNNGNPFDSDVTFGVGFPFSYGLSDKLDLGAQPQFDFVPDETGKHELSYFQTIVIGGPLAGALDFYVEGLAVFPKGDAQYLLNGGLIYNVSPNIKVDAATNLGLNEASPTRVYMGLSFRI